jgi:hypothetical protein
MITATLNAIAMPPIELEFIHSPIEKTVDVETLDNSVYTDLTGARRGLWTFNYDSLTEAEYNLIRAAYDAQFTALYQYPLLSIPYYSVIDQPCRMTINEKNIWNNCGSVQNVQITFRETPQLPEVS